VYATTSKWLGVEVLIGSTIVDIATVAERHDDHEEHVVRHGVDDPVVPDSDAKTGADPAVPVRLVDAGSAPARRSRLGGVVESQGPACAGLSRPLGGTRCGRGSRPAEVGFDLLPGDVGTFFRYRGIEGRDVLGVLQGGHELFVALGLISTAAGRP